MLVTSLWDLGQSSNAIMSFLEASVLHKAPKPIRPQLGLYRSDCDMHSALQPPLKTKKEKTYLIYTNIYRK